MKSTHDFGSWSQPTTFSVTRVNLTQESNELSDLSNHLSSIVITPISLRDYESTKQLADSLNQIIKQTQEITSFLHMSIYINPEHPANLKAEKVAFEVDHYAREANRNLKRLAIRQISSGDNFQLVNQITIATANLKVALSNFCRVLDEAKYHESFFMRTNCGMVHF